jgi:hypothetical protein
LGAVGCFGILVTLGLLAYELFGIKKCHRLIQAGKALEQEMHLPGSKQLGEPAGQFIRRPNNLLWIVNEPFAAAIIFPTVLAAWIYLALLYENPSLGIPLSLCVLVGGFGLILLYDGFLRNQDKLRNWFQKAASHLVPGTSPNHSR